MLRIQSIARSRGGDRREPDRTGHRVDAAKRELRAERWRLRVRGWRDFWKRFARRKDGIIGLLILGFFAAIFDQGGLYYTNDVTKTWDYITPQTNNIPSSFYATSISARQDWVESVIVPEPSAAALTGLGLVVFGATVRRRAQRATRSI